MMFASLEAVWQRRELVRMLVVRNLQIRYKGSALGFLWSLLTPGLAILVYAVFASIIGMRGRLGADPGSVPYLPFLISGIVVWQFTAGCLNDGLHAVTGSANLVKKAAFPRLVLPLSLTLANAVNFALTLAVLLLYLAFSPAVFGNPAWLLLGVAAQAALGLGLAMIASAANVFFRDAEHVCGVATLAWFFLTPVFYPLPMQTAWLGPSHAWLVYLNPMTGILAAYRQSFLSEGPWLPGVSLSVAVAFAVLAAGLLLFRRVEGRFGDVL